jgi:hypothetical protein
LHEYFYGPLRPADSPETFSPPSVTLNIADMHLIRHSITDASDSLRPLGDTAVTDPVLKFERVVINEQNKDEFLNLMIAGGSPLTPPMPHLYQY